MVAEPGKPFPIDNEGVSAPIADHSVFFYGAEQFNDFVLRLQFRLSGPIGSSGKPVDNSGVFLRFHAPHASGGDLPTNSDPALSQRVAADPAWVAAFTGFEVQIDERARPDNSDQHRTGAIYAVSTGAGELQNFTAGPALQPGQWNDMEITVQSHRYTVKINSTQTTDFQNPRNNVVSEAPGLPLKSRGLPKSEDPLSGYVGVQAHTSHIAFRNIQIKRL